MAKSKDNGDEKEDKKKKVEKPKDLGALMKSLNKTYGDGTIMQGRENIVKAYAIPTLVPTIDVAFGVGGLPEGRIVEMYGLESSGKTTTCIQFIAACQGHFFPHKNRKGVCAFVDAEHAFDPDWATKCGVNVDSLLFSQPNSGEEAFDIVDKICDSGLVDLVVVDSVANLVPKQELEGEVGDNVIGAQARLMSKGLRMISGKTSKSKTTVIFINQIRQKIGVMFGNPETTPGGMALKFYASLRIQINKGSPVKDGKETIGFSTNLSVKKNKCAPPFTTAEYGIRFGDPCSGVDSVESMLKVAGDMQLIEKSSSYFIFEGQKINGYEAAAEFLRKNDTIRDALMGKIYDNLRGRTEHLVSTVSGDDEGDPLDDDILDSMRDSDE